jgi:hypothetical protein
MFLGATWPRNISYISRPRCPYSLMFVKIYSSVMSLGWSSNISYVRRPPTYVPRFLVEKYLSVFCRVSLQYTESRKYELSIDLLFIDTGRSPLMVVTFPVFWVSRSAMVSFLEALLAFLDSFIFFLWIISSSIHISFSYRYVNYKLIKITIFDKINTNTRAHWTTWSWDVSCFFLSSPHLTISASPKHASTLNDLILILTSEMSRAFATVSLQDIALLLFEIAMTSYPLYSTILLDLIFPDSHQRLRTSHKW